MLAILKQKLSVLLELDKQKSDAAQSSIILTDTFGDAILFQTNSLFRSVREKAAKCGYRFSANSNQLYDALPLTQLEMIHKTKIIPYTPNRAAVEFVANHDRDASWEDIADGFRRCFAFHEACHAVARTEINAFGRENDWKVKLDNSELTFLSLLEESFANTCELLGVVDCASPQLVAYYEANSYTALRESRHDLLQVQREVGAEGFFRYLHLCYLEACFLRQGLSEKDFNKILSLANLEISDARLRKRLKTISHITFTLDQGFREVTTRLHLRINGLRTDLDQLHPLEYFETSRGFLSLLDRLATLATRP